MGDTRVFHLHFSVHGSLTRFFLVSLRRQVVSERLHRHDVIVDHVALHFLYE